MVIIMDISKKLLTLLAIFCVIASAGVVCAADAGNHDGAVGNKYENISSLTGSHYGGANDRLTDTSISEHNYTHMEHAAGEPVENTSSSNNTVNDSIATNSVSQSANSNVKFNETGNASSNATTYHSMLATGNPILGFLAIGAILGGSAIINRRNRF